MNNPIYDGHTNLADMINGHLHNWRLALETARGLESTSFGKQYIDHELRALDRIAHAVEYDLAKFEPKQVAPACPGPSAPVGDPMHPAGKSKPYRLGEVEFREAEHGAVEVKGIIEPEYSGQPATYLQWIQVHSVFRLPSDQIIIRTPVKDYVVVAFNKSFQHSVLWGKMWQRFPAIY